MPPSEGERGWGPASTEDVAIDFLVMEYLEGETLADRLGKGALPLDQALKYAIEIADALDKAHRQGVTHRDLKPANIMLTKAGAKLLDFGLAKLTRSNLKADLATLAATRTQEQPLTEKGTVPGTVQYMAPEQLEGKDTDSRSNIFAFGAIVYEMVTGQRAFQGKSQLSLITAILEHDPPPVSEVQRMTPRALDRIVQTCLAKAPEDRWQAAADIARQLCWTVGRSSMDAAPTIHGLEESGDSPPRPRIRRRANAARPHPKAQVMQKLTQPAPQ